MGVVGLKIVAVSYRTSKPQSGHRCNGDVSVDERLNLKRRTLQKNVSEVRSHGADRTAPWISAGVACRTKSPTIAAHLSAQSGAVRTSCGEGSLRPSLALATPPHLSSSAAISSGGTNRAHSNIQPLFNHSHQ